MYFFINIIGVFSVIFAILWLLTRHGFNSIVRTPLFLFSCYFMIIHFLTPLVKEYVEIYRYQPYYNQYTLIYSSLIAVFVFIITITANFWSQSRYKKIFNRPIQFDRIITKFDGVWSCYVGIVLLTIGAFFAYRDLSTIISQAGGLDSFLSDRHISSEGRGLERLFVNLLISGSVLLLAGILNSKRVIFWPVFFAGIGFAIYYFNAISSRNGILLIVLFNLVVYLFYRPSARRITAKSIARFTALSVVAVTVIYLAMSVIIQRYSVSDSDYLVERRENVLFYALDGAFGNDEARLWMIENGQDYFFGQTYLAAFVVPVPRKLWKAKPLGAGPGLINMIRPGSYIIGASGNNSLTTGLLVEARMNFGLPGVIASVIIWAWLANWMLAKAWKSRELFTQLSWLLAAVSLSSMLLYSEFLGYFARILIVIFPILFTGIVKPKRSIRT